VLNQTIIVAVIKFPIGKIQKDIKSFLRLAGYYRGFTSDTVLLPDL
jgi:hypothetical protein